MDTNLLIKYSNKWVALTNDRKKIIASAKNIKELDKKVKMLKKYSDIIYHHVLPINGHFVPQWQTIVMGRQGFFNLFKKVIFDEKGDFGFLV